ncbi:MAG: CpsD/CapB family tyrosine-protein kinase [Halobacteria archaeon]|nr:CpsD/CapB family tyrosine-protein kinase [Halobacteria archaeon]
MERIKQALEKARQERETRQEGSAVARPVPPVPAAGDAGGSGAAVTPAVSLDEAVLRDKRIIAGMAPGSFPDAYNLLRTRILQVFKENGWNSLGITSPGPGAGSTLTALNLAISMAREVDYTVLLVDANLRQPALLGQLGLEPRPGLSDYLSSDTSLTDLLFRPGLVEHLVILPGGEPLANSAEMLNSPRMGRLAEEMKSRYHTRIVIYDLPPVLGSSDTLAFAPHLDAALLVVEDGVTQKQEIEQAVELLSVTNIVGTVLNKSESPGS